MITTLKFLSFVFFPLVFIEFGYRAARRRFLLRLKATMKGGAA